MEEESIVLLSSLSPKVKHCRKYFRKGTTVLALRKSLQRSSIYDKSVHTTNNEELILTESSSTTTVSSSNRSSKKLLNETPISIHDSDSENEVKLISSESATKVQNIQNDRSSVKDKRLLLPQDKFENIKQWIDNVNLENEVVKDNSAYSAFSEVSTIYGDENSANFVTERTGRAVNSTAIGATSIHFEKFFKRKTDYVPETKTLKPKRTVKLINNELNYVGKYSLDEVSSSSSNGIQSLRDMGNASARVNSLDNDIISESDNSERSLVSNGDNQTDQDHCLSASLESLNDYNIQSNVKKVDEYIGNDSDDSFGLNESLNTKLRKYVKNQNDIDRESTTDGKSNNNMCSEHISIKDENVNETELASMLDDLYGNKWRAKEEHVLPKSEPRKRFHKLSTDVINREPNTERKPKLSVLYKNPYLETEKLKSASLLQSLQKSKLKYYMESPMAQRLNQLCDSDTNSDISYGERKPKMRLDFNDSDCEEEKTSKYFKDHVQSIDKAISEYESKKENGSDKENADEFSFLGQSLEERIRRKINGVKDVSGKGKKKEKKSSDTKMPLTNKCDPDSKNVDKKIKNTKKKGEQKSDNRKLSSASNSSSDEAWEMEISKIVHKNKPFNGKYTFLASLSANVPILQCDMSARIYRNNFKLYKDELLKKLFKLYNEEVFEKAIPQDTTLEWNDRMRGTAGFCYCKKITRRTGAVERSVRIVLATKVIDSANRLRDTLIHEMCHAATWIVNCVSDGHGSYWKSWAKKAMQTFPELPPIKRCHDYVINTKYTYKCTGCGYSIGRHSKSIDIERKRCGYCLGKFVILLNKVSKMGETKSVPATPKKEATGFALFVKENYATYKQANLKHGDVMRLLGQKFQEMKLKPS